MEEDTTGTSSNTSTPTKHSEHDVFLSLKHPAYKAIMHAQFRELGRRKNTDEHEAAEKNTASEVFQMFKRRGGKFFKLQHPATYRNTRYYEVDGDAALESELVCSFLVWDILF